MSTRLASGGRLLNRGRAHEFQFNGKRLKGYEGDTLASALLANDQMMVGRSFKYHRPRGVVASGAEEPNALVNLGKGGKFEPNQRTTTTELFDGRYATSKNHWPTLEFVIGAFNALFARFLPAGFYYKTFMTPRPFWKHIYEPFIRQSAGLGKAPKDRDADTYEHFYFYADVVVIGGGVAGLQAALEAGKAGARVLVMEQTADWGGRAVVDGVEIAGQPADDWVKGAVQALEKMENVTLRTRCMGAGVYDHGYILGYERLTDHDPVLQGPRHRLWRIRAKQTITATGAIERLDAQLHGRNRGHLAKALCVHLIERCAREDVRAFGLRRMRLREKHRARPEMVTADLFRLVRFRHAHVGVAHDREILAPRFQRRQRRPA